MRRWQKYVAAGLILIIVLAGVSFALFRENLLVDYYSTQLNKPGANGFHWMRKMVEAGPTGTRRALELCKHGSYDGDLEQISAYILMYADHDVYPCVSTLFSDPDPRARAYAACVAGHLRDERYLARLKKVTEDDTRLPEGWFDETVAERAKTACGWIRNQLPVSEETKRWVDTLTALPED